MSRFFDAQGKRETQELNGFWQFCDIRTCPEMVLNRARGFNNKGIVNEYRKPKMAYGAIRTLFHRFREGDV